MNRRAKRDQHITISLRWHFIDPIPAFAGMTNFFQKFVLKCIRNMTDFTGPFLNYRGRQIYDSPHNHR